MIGEGLLGEVLLGDSGEEFPGAHGQALAQIIAFDFNRHGQAQASIVQTYNSFAQAQSVIIVVVFGQAQAFIFPVVVGQVQARILSLYYAFAQNQAQIKQIYTQLAQAQGTVLNIYNQSAQALASITNFTANANSQSRILQTYNGFAQSNARTKLTDFGLGQAEAYIYVAPVGQANALIDSPIKNETGQAQAFICWIDTFTRTTAFGLGADYTWAGFEFETEEDSTYHVDGTKVVNSPDFQQSDAYTINKSVPIRGTARFDFTTRSIFTENPYAGIILGDVSDQTKKPSLVVYGSNGEWYLSVGWYSGIGPADVPVTILPSKTYRAKLSYDELGRVAAKVWDISETEPDWQIRGIIPNYTPANTAWIDFLFDFDITSFDNLEFCTFESFSITESVSAQAAALIIRYEGYGNAQGQITNTSANGAAQAYILWTPVILPFEDTFTRTTAHGLGQSHYLWQEGTGDHPAATTIYVDGTRVVIPPGADSSYRLQTSLQRIGHLEFDIIFDALDTPVIQFTISASPEPYIVKVWKPFPFSSNLSIYLYRGITFLNGSSFAPVIGETYSYKFEWTDSIWRTRFGTNGVFTSSASGASTVNVQGSTNPLIELIGGSTSNVYLSRLAFDYRTLGFAQAAALINSPIKNRTGQARARVMYRRYQHGQANALIDPTRKKYGAARARIKLIGNNRHAQAQALLNTGFGRAQAQALIGAAPLLQAYAQAQALIYRTVRVRGQAQARIKIQRWVWGQAQAVIKGRLGIGQAKALILQYDISKFGQAQAYIVRDFRTGLAQAWIEQEGSYSFAQAQANINLSLKVGQAQAVIGRLVNVRFGQARSRIRALTLGIGQALAKIRRGNVSVGNAQANIVSYTNKFGQASAFILRPIRHGNAQAFILQTQAGGLVRYNGFYLPGYLQSEELSSPMRINIIDPTYGEVSQEYLGLENKLLSLRFTVVQSTYQQAKEKVLLAGSLVRSNRNEYTRLTVIDTTKHYLAKTKSINLEQRAGIRENAAEYTVVFECKPWAYGDYHTITGTTLLDTNDVNRTIGNGTWTPATIVVTGNDVTVSGYTTNGEFTGYVSVSGAVSNMILDSENYTVTMAGQSRNDLLKSIDHKLMVAPGRTLFAVTGATNVEIIYQDRWPL